MTHRTPPRLATYLLLRFAARYHRQALIGDLLEEHARGRSSAWYWGQVIGVLGSSALQALRRHCYGLIAVAAWWSILLYLSFALSAPLILFALDPSVYWLLKRRRQRREAAHRAALLVLFVCVYLPWGLPRPADAAQAAAQKSATTMQHALPCWGHPEPGPVPQCSELHSQRPSGSAPKPCAAGDAGTVHTP